MSKIVDWRNDGRDAFRQANLARWAREKQVWQEVNQDMGSKSQGVAWNNPNGAAVRAEFDRRMSTPAPSPPPPPAPAPKPEFDHNKYLEDMRANNERIQAQFDQRMAALNQQMAAQQNVYAKSLETMQNTLKATMSPNIRESVLGVKGASTGGSDSQAQARQGLKGTFSRSGMRIKKIKDQSLNVA